MINQNFLKSSIGRKYIVALTGLFLIIFLLGHLAGNLQIFLGQDALNAYATFLHEHPSIVWTFRFLLVVAFLLHMRYTSMLKLENMRARPVRYGKEATIQATLSSRTMLMTGMVIITFVIYHNLHYAFGLVHHEYFDQQDYLGRHDVYSMIVMSFREPAIFTSYLVAVAVLSLHLRHALPSFFQTLGIESPGVRKKLDQLGLFFAILLFTGYASIPISVILKLIKLPAEVI